MSDNLYDKLFNSRKGEYRMIGEIIARSSFRFSVRTVQGAIMQVKGGDEYNIGDKIFIVGDRIERKAPNLPQVEVVI